MTDAPLAIIGDALIDEIHHEDGSVAEFVGGAALNVAVGLSILGIPTTLIAMVGDDADGDRIREYLSGRGVGLIGTPAPYGSSRGVSTRVNGEPRYVFNAAAQNRAIEFGAEVRAAIDAAPYVVTSCFPFDDAAQTAALRAAVARSAERFIVDPNPRTSMMHDTGAFRAAIDDLAADTLLLKIGEEDSALLYDLPLESATAHLLNLGAGCVLATAGAEGASVHTPHGTMAREPIAELPGPIVDTMGAGDATLAAVVADIVRRGHLPADAAAWSAALRHAMLIAAATCRGTGALLRVPRENSPR